MKPKVILIITVIICYISFCQGVNKSKKTHKSKKKHNQGTSNLKWTTVQEIEPEDTIPIEIPSTDKVLQLLNTLYTNVNSLFNIALAIDKSIQEKQVSKSNIESISNTLLSRYLCVLENKDTLIIEQEHMRLIKYLQTQTDLINKRIYDYINLIKLQKSLDEDNRLQKELNGIIHSLLEIYINTNKELQPIQNECNTLYKNKFNERASKKEMKSNKKQSTEDFLLKSLPINKDIPLYSLIYDELSSISNTIANVYGTLSLESEQRRIFYDINTFLNTQSILNYLNTVDLEINNNYFIDDPYINMVFNSTKSKHNYQKGVKTQIHNLFTRILKSMSMDTSNKYIREMIFLDDDEELSIKEEVRKILDPNYPHCTMEAKKMLSVLLDKIKNQLLNSISYMNKRYQELANDLLKHLDNFRSFLLHNTYNNLMFLVFLSERFNIFNKGLSYTPSSLYVTVAIEKFGGVVPSKSLFKMLEDNENIPLELILSWIQSSIYPLIQELDNIFYNIWKVIGTPSVFKEYIKEEQDKILEKIYESWNISIPIEDLENYILLDKKLEEYIEKNILPSIPEFEPITLTKYSLMFYNYINTRYHEICHLVGKNVVMNAFLHSFPCCVLYVFDYLLDIALYNLFSAIDEYIKYLEAILRMRIEEASNPTYQYIVDNLTKIQEELKYMYYQSYCTRKMQIIWMVLEFNLCHAFTFIEACPGEVAGSSSATKSKYNPNKSSSTTKEDKLTGVLLKKGWLSYTGIKNILELIGATVSALTYKHNKVYIRKQLQLEYKGLIRLTSEGVYYYSSILRSCANAIGKTAFHKDKTNCLESLNYLYTISKSSMNTPLDTALMIMYDERKQKDTVMGIDFIDNFLFFNALVGKIFDKINLLANYQEILCCNDKLKVDITQEYIKVANIINQAYYNKIYLYYESKYRSAFTPKVNIANRILNLAWGLITVLEGSLSATETKNYYDVSPEIIKKVEEYQKSLFKEEETKEENTNENHNNAYKIISELNLIFQRNNISFNIREYTSKVDENRQTILNWLNTNNTISMACGYTMITSYTNMLNYAIFPFYPPVFKEYSLISCSFGLPSDMTYYRCLCPNIPTIAPLWSN
ncbi:hypothetical protein NEOKW01_0834 [Nematocida sp. AWRm80]|nr:hypothetical protein NEOKW01_0834 [Nematocida sp. AWRm80]